ncbi:hypothetical protein IAE22_34455, partial [Bacillus sp. S34]|nr:hypothetical protein [Bacillus sp. S34]
MVNTWSADPLGPLARVGQLRSGVHVPAVRVRAGGLRADHHGHGGAARAGAGVGAGARGLRAASARLTSAGGGTAGAGRARPAAHP